MDTRSGALVVLAQQGALLRRNLRKPVPIESRRIALERMITLDFPHCGAFFAEYSSNISMTGMFIRTDRIQPPGTIVQLEFSLADGSSLIKGRAEVVWVRRRNESPDRPSGLGLRFLELDKESRQLIRWAVEQRLRDSKSAADDNSSQAPATGSRAEKNQKALATEAKTTTSPSTETSSKQSQGSTQKDSGAQNNKSADKTQLESRLHSYAGARAAQEDSNRWRWAVYFAVAGLLASVLFFLYRGSEPSSVVRETEPAAGPAKANATDQPTQEVARAVSEPSVKKPAVEKPAVEKSAVEKSAAEKPVSIAEQPPSLESEITAAVSSWAEAWSMQRVDDYLDCYATDFQPQGRLSLAQWRKQRRARIEAPASIEVAVSNLELQLLDDERARVSFLQSYRSDRYQDRMRKTLELVRENEDWKIQVERSES